MIKLLQKEWLLLILIVALIMSMAAFLFNGNPVKTQSNDNVQSSSIGTITANGEAGVKVVPDVAYINVGVSTEGKDIEKIQTENTTKMDSMIKTLKEFGVKETEILTTNYSINPQYQWNEMSRKNEMVGYVVSNTVEVTINKIDNTGKIIDAMVKNGSNQVYGIRFGISDKSELYNQALEMAVKDAHTKAVSMGKGMNISNIKVSKILENSARQQPIYYEANKFMDMAAEVSTPINGGELEVRASVVVDFIFQ